MSDTVTIEEAINTGLRMINRPVRIIQLTTLALSTYIIYKFQFPDWTYILILPLAVIVPWVYWSFMITKWRIWAFENVRDVHELKSRAIAEKLIWPDGSIFEKTEIRTSQDRERLMLIEKRFE